MITKSLFIECIEKHKSQNKRLDQLEELGFEIWDTPVIEFGWQMFDAFLDSNFNEYGKDWINWWLYERTEFSDMKAYNEDGSEIPMDTIEDLWNLVEKYRI
jgi:hypothetical protein